MKINSIGRKIQMKKTLRKTKLKAYKQEKAITLIALVITVIVLLILARCKYSNVNRR